MEARLPEPRASFDAARDHLEGLILRLIAPETTSMSHSDVENFIVRDGRETLRLLYQAHLDLRSQARPIAPVVGADGVVRGHRRVGTVGLKSMLGEVSVTREGYRAREATGVYPLDGALNLPAQLYSFPLEKYVAVEASKTSFEETSAAVEAATGQVVAKRQAEEVAGRAAIDFEAFYETRKFKPDTDDGAGSIIAITGDSKGVAIREEDLRPATKKAAAKRRQAAAGRHPEITTTPRKKEKDHRKRMAMVAAVY